MLQKLQLAGNRAREFATYVAVADPTLTMKMCPLFLYLEMNAVYFQVIVLLFWTHFSKKKVC